MRPEEMLDTIAAKRDGQRLDAVTLAAWIDGTVRGEVPDYQVTALLMAIYLRGLDVDETAALTGAIARSGGTLDVSDLGPVVDKHSTGGVGDTVSLIAAPLAAACGVVIPMLSGRALGHTGGTLDKLEAIPGLETRLAPAAMRAALRRAGLVIAEAGPDLAPADAILYRLRDASATVGEPGLIIASILGKKLCVAPRALVMDLKIGSGGVLADRAAGHALAARMHTVGERLGLEIRFLLSDMQLPLSSAIGNAVEVERAIRLLRGELGAPAAGATGSGLDGRRLLELSLAVAGEMIAAAGLAPDGDVAGLERARDALATGAGAATLARMIEAQGGDPGVVDDPGRHLPAPRHCERLAASRAGSVTAIDAGRTGAAAAALGVGRARVDARADPTAGIVLACDVGMPVKAGDLLAELAGADARRLARARRLLAGAIEIGAASPATVAGTALLERWQPGGESGTRD
jgi:pyrimidine-nucleoside phosphorylase